MSSALVVDDDTGHAASVRAEQPCAVFISRLSDGHVIEAKSFARMMDELGSTQNTSDL